MPQASRPQIDMAFGDDKGFVADLSKEVEIASSAVGRSGSATCLVRRKQAELMPATNDHLRS